MGTIGRRINTAIVHLTNKDYENALIQVCIAIDGTAKRKWPSYKPGKRIRKFVEEYKAFIYQFATTGGLRLSGTGNQKGEIYINNSSLPDILYKSIRCSLHHGDELMDYVDLQEGNNFIGVSSGKFILNNGFINGFLLAVVADNINRNELCETNHIFTYTSKEIRINNLWGNMAEIEKITGYRKVL